MKIVDKPSSNLFTIQCGCGKMFDHNNRQPRVYCISCGLWGSLEELRKDEANKEEVCHKECEKAK